MAKNTENKSVEILVVDVVAEQIANEIRDITEPNNKWAMVLKLALANVDESILPLEQCSDVELKRRLNGVWSKKTNSKKAVETAQMVYVDAIANGAEQAKLDTLTAIVSAKQAEYDAAVAEEDTIAKLRGTIAKSNHSGPAKTDADPSTLDQVELGKLIRNLQSKKSGAKKAGDETAVVEWQAKIDAAAKYRTSTPAAARANQITNQIQPILDALKQLPESPEVLEQIKKLEALL